MSDIYTPPLPPSPIVVWPLDDTEESVVGTDLHQMTIMNLRWGINEIARAVTPQGGPAPWQALSQTVVTGFHRPDNSRYRTMPDVFVYRHPIGSRRGSVATSDEGPPALIIEVLSDSTADVDLDMKEGKGYSYARAGVQKYLTIDPAGDVLPELARAWRLDGTAYRRWEPDFDGRWRSESIAAAFGLEGLMAAVYTRDGERQLREGEVAEERARARAELARRDEELARRDEELAELRRLVEQLRQG